MGHVRHERAFSIGAVLRERPAERTRQPIRQMLSGDEEIEGGILGVDARRSRGTKPREIGLQFR
jgi:hypothetical protein